MARHACSFHSITIRRLIAFQMLNTISKTVDLPTQKKRKSTTKGKFDLPSLPNEIILNIFDNLDVFDTATLALTCKRFANIATTYSKLEFPMTTNPDFATWGPHKERHFLKRRLGDNFFSKRMRYCWNCRHYVPRRAGFWKRKLAQKGMEGRMPSFFKRMSFAEWWALPKTGRVMAQWNSGQAFKCPRCRLCRAL